MSVIVVIPTYKENQTLTRLLPELEKALSKRLKGVFDPYRIILVDDTKDFETRAFEKDRVICIPRIRKKRGYAKSLLLGLTIACHCFKPNIIIQMDADHHYKDVIEFLDLDRKFGDIIVGFEMKNSIYSRVASFLARKLLGIKMIQPTCGFRMWNHPVLDSLDFNKIKASGFDVQLEMLWLAKYQDWKITGMELSKESSKRYYDKSKMSFKQVIKHLFLFTRLSRKSLYGWITTIIQGRK